MKLKHSKSDSIKLTYASFFSKLYRFTLNKPFCDDNVLIISPLFSDPSKVNIIEASDHVGGRVSTYRDPAGWQVELGAMRVPKSHLLLRTFIKDIFNLETQEFPHFDPETYVYANGIRVKTKDYLKDPDIVGYETRAHEKGRTAEELFDAVLKPYVQEINEHGWQVFLEKYDGLTLRDCLYGEGNISSAAAAMMGILTNMEGFLDYGLTEALEIFYDDVDDIHFDCIRDGNDLLPKALASALDSNEITFNASVVKVSQTADQVIVEYVEEGRVKNMSGDQVLMTSNPVAMSFIEFDPPLSFTKRDALRQSRNACSSKLFLAFSERFWEKEGIFGGKTTTDLPSHMLYYLKGGSNFTGGIIMSYTWGDRSCVFAAMGENELLQMALSNLATIHGENIRELFTGGVAKHWSLHPYIFGAYAFQTPFQRLKIQKELESAADRIWFAGEYISVPHAWMESAVKSALRTAVYMSTDMHSEFFP